MTEPVKSPSTSQKMAFNHLRLHYGVVVVLYALGILIAYKTLSHAEAQKDVVALLSTGAILATFGSAIGAIGQIWQQDLLERARLNIDILFKDILKQEISWRRWPFVPRSSVRKLLDGGTHYLTLSNPDVPLDVGTHVIKINLPTVPEDFFDLPLFKNYWPLLKFRSSAQTVLGNREKGSKNPKTGLEPSDEYLAYECMLDIWSSVLKFRIARYVIHFGSGLTIAGAATAGLFVTTQFI